MIGVRVNEACTNTVTENLEVLRLTDLNEALQEPTPDVDPDGDYTEAESE